jgi:ankyrin repeat protein
MNRTTTSLIEAVRAGNHSLVQDFVASGASANERDEGTGETLLTLACELADAPLVKILLDAGADPNAPSCLSPLDVAAGRGHLEIFELLLDADADVEAIDEDGGTALESAACGGHREIVSLLLEAGANPKHKDHFGKSAIIYAAERGHAAIVAELMPLSTPKVRQQADLMLRLKAQGEPSPQVLKFFAAVVEGDLDEVRRYLDEGGNIEVMDESGTTALAQAASVNAAVVKLLVERGANLAHVDANGCCPVEYATACPAAFNYLFPITPKKLRKSVERDAPFFAGLDDRMAALERKMLEHGPPNETILSYVESARAGKLEEVQAYLANGGRVDAMDKDGVTALMWAAYSGQFDVVKHLVAAGADVNHVSQGRGFALIMAGARNECFTYFYLQPLTEKVLRDYSDAFVKSRHTWWM